TNFRLSRSNTHMGWGWFSKSRALIGVGNIVCIQARGFIDTGAYSCSVCAMAHEFGSRLPKRASLMPLRAAVIMRPSFANDVALLLPSRGNKSWSRVTGEGSMYFRASAAKILQLGQRRRIASWHAPLYR